MYTWFVLIVRWAPTGLDTPIPIYEVDIASVDQAASETPFYGFPPHDSRTGSRRMASSASPREPSANASLVLTAQHHCGWTTPIWVCGWARAHLLLSALSQPCRARAWPVAHSSA